jgi:hypothetical protein
VTVLSDGTQKVIRVIVDPELREFDDLTMEAIHRIAPDQGSAHE